MPLTGSFFNPYNQYSGKNRHNYDCEFSRLQGYYFRFIEYCTPVPRSLKKVACPGLDDTAGQAYEGLIVSLKP